MVEGRFSQGARQARAGGPVAGVSRKEAGIYFLFAVFYFVMTIVVFRNLLGFLGIWVGLVTVIIVQIVWGLYNRALKRTSRAHPHGYKWRLNLALWFPLVAPVIITLLQGAEIEVDMTWPLTIILAVVGVAPMLYLGIWMLMKSRGGSGVGSEAGEGA